jgi:hypothetical protein
MSLFERVELKKNAECIKPENLESSWILLPRNTSPGPSSRAAMSGNMECSSPSIKKEKLFPNTVIAT